MVVASRPRREAFDASEKPTILLHAQRIPATYAADFNLQNLSLLPVEVREVLVRLLAAFQKASPDAWLALVGGCARDLLHARVPSDFDVAIGGLPEKSVIPILRQHFPGRVRGVGRTHPVIKLRVPLGGGDGKAGPDRWEIDMVWEHAGALDPTVWRQLASRRDFTINSMAFRLAPEFDAAPELLDPFEGAADLARLCLRGVTDQSFTIDPLRVYRAAQMVARFELQVDPLTEQWIVEGVRSGQLDNLPRERVTQEWKSLLLRAERPSAGLEKLRKWGVLERLNPELTRLATTPQDVRYHPEGDVWEHTKMVVDQAARLVRELYPPATPFEREAVLFGALCHDLGKPYTTVEHQGQVTAYGHEAAGVIPAQAWLSRLTLSEETVQAVLTCVEQHMRPSSLTRCIDAGELSMRQQINVMRRLVRDVAAAGWRVFLTVCEADKRGRGFPDATTEPYRPAQVLNPLLVADPSSTLPLLRGRDLLELGHSAGRALGPILKGLEKARDEGIVSTREEALAWVQQHFPLRPRA